MDDTDENDSCKGKWDFLDNESQCVAPTMLYRIPTKSLPTEDVIGRLGQPVSTLIMRELENARPYPGDPERECKEEYWFLAYVTNEGRSMVIMDNVTYEDTLLDIETAERTNFMTAWWYAILCTQQSGVSVDGAPIGPPV